jgi:hypothetical protein
MLSLTQAGRSDPLIRDARTQLVFTRRWLDIKASMLAAAAARSVDKMRTTLQEAMGMVFIVFKSEWFCDIFCYACWFLSQLQSGFVMSDCEVLLFCAVSNLVMYSCF